ncbi:acyl carrier protein [Pseudomonas sp. TH31]|nr:acyl carrier protein [Pseudomonas sp. TH31]
MQALTPAAGVDLLVRLIDGVDASMTQIAPFVGDNEKIRRSVAPDGLRSSSAQTAGAVAIAEGRSESATPEQLKLRLKALVSALTGLLPENIDDRCSFGDLGLNSVMLQQLAQDIEEQFKVPMAPNTLFTYNSVAQLIDYLHERGRSLRPRSRLPARTHARRRHRWQRRPALQTSMTNGLRSSAWTAACPAARTWPDSGKD